MGNRCSYILDQVQPNMEKHYIRQIRELENQYLVPPVFFRKAWTLLVKLIFNFFT